jgi:hypothetical protein
MGYQYADYQTKSAAKAAITAGTLTQYQQSVVQRGYAAYVAGGGKKKIEGWFATMVDGSTNTVSPFENIIKEYNLTGGSYTTVGDTTTIENGTTGKTGTGTGAVDERLKELRSINAALAANPEADLTDNAGVLQGQLVQYANAMGLMKSLKEINSYVRDIYANDINPKDIQDELRRQAIVLYPNFADRIKSDPDLTIKDLVNPYLQVMADTLEIDPNTVNMTDPTIQNAISGTNLRSLADFRMDMRNDSRFASTRTAKREAVDFAQSLLKGFGFSI